MIYRVIDSEVLKEARGLNKAHLFCSLSCVAEEGYFEDAADLISLDDIDDDDVDAEDGIAKCESCLKPLSGDNIG